MTSTANNLPMWQPPFLFFRTYAERLLRSPTDVGASQPLRRQHLFFPPLRKFFGVRPATSAPGLLPAMTAPGFQAANPSVLEPASSSCCCSLPARGSSGTRYLHQSPFRLDQLGLPAVAEWPASLRSAPAWREPRPAGRGRVQ